MTATVCMTYDLDAVAPWGFRHEMPGNHEIGVFGAEVATPRLLDVHDRYDIPSTWFVPGHTIESFPDVCESVHDRGHEIQHHSWSHAPNPDYTTRGHEELDFRRAFELIEELTGSPPTGYRTPAGGFSKYTVEILQEYDIEWVSTLGARDFEPYYLRTGWSIPRDGPYESGEPTDIVKVPYHWARDDWLQGGPIVSPPHPELPPTLGAMVTDEDVFARLRREYDWMTEYVEDGVFVVLLHPQHSGRASAVAELEDLVEHMLDTGARFAEVSTVATEFRN